MAEQLLTVVRTTAALVPATVPPTQASAPRSSARPPADAGTVGVPSSFPDETEAARPRQAEGKQLGSAQRRSSPEPAEAPSTSVRKVSRLIGRRADLTDTSRFASEPRGRSICLRMISILCLEMGM